MLTLTLPPARHGNRGFATPNQTANLNPETRFSLLQAPFKNLGLKMTDLIATIAQLPTLSPKHHTLNPKPYTTTAAACARRSCSR